MSGFCTADFWSSLAYESAEQKPKHCLTPRFLIPLLLTYREMLVVGVSRHLVDERRHLRGREGRQQILEVHVGRRQHVAAEVHRARHRDLIEVMIDRAAQFWNEN